MAVQRQNDCSETREFALFPPSGHIFVFSGRIPVAKAAFSSSKWNFSFSHGQNHAPHLQKPKNKKL
jgi:hypothetical protein